MRPSLGKAAAGFAAAGFATLGWALVEARAYTLRRFHVPLLPAGAEPLKILHLSDLHLLPTDQRRINWIQALARHKPDLVVTTGDNLAHLDAVPAVMEALNPFLDLPGAFVTGSNDYYLPVLKNPLRYFRIRESVGRPTKPGELPTAQLISALSSAGWAYLDNARSHLTIHDLKIDLVGTGDAHINQDSYPAPLAPRAAVDLRLGLTHAPYERVLSRMRMDGVDLALAGHTHGGQVCIPGYGALVTNCDIDRRIVKGLHRWPGEDASTTTAQEMWLHVSAGLGTSPFTPIRVACRPEASLITLVPTQ